jgi:hypothetical protein
MDNTQDSNYHIEQVDEDEGSIEEPIAPFGIFFVGSYLIGFVCLVSLPV